MFHHVFHWLSLMIEVEQFSLTILLSTDSGHFTLKIQERILKHQQFSLSVHSLSSRNRIHIKLKLLNYIFDVLKTKH
jgi:hypothetical protein